MQDHINKIAFGLIIGGALLSLGRDFWTPVVVKLYTKISGRSEDSRLRPVLTLYLMLTGMILTVVGLLGLFNILKF